MKVYIGTSGGYEHCTLVRAFATEAQAQAWVASCNAYDAMENRPRYSDDDSNFEQEHKRVMRWRKKHPAGEHNCDEWYGYQGMEVLQP